MIFSSIHYFFDVARNRATSASHIAQLSMSRGYKIQAESGSIDIEAPDLSVSIQLPFSQDTNLRDSLDVNAYIMILHPQRDFILSDFDKEFEAVGGYHKFHLDVAPDGSGLAQDEYALAGNARSFSLKLSVRSEIPPPHSGLIVDLTVIRMDGEVEELMVE